MAEEESPLIKALPPESDYLTYLTIVEYNLSTESLPILHKVLQDEALTTNIGWDLVHLLIPYLPESEECLHDIARLGNPREVILKVTESLRLIEYEDEEASDDDDKEATVSVVSGASETPARVESSTDPIEKATIKRPENTGSSQATKPHPPLPLAVHQFITLLSMLAILHTRIETKHPSRFLSTTLQAILASFSNSTNHREELILAIVTAINSIAGTKRPVLPNRQSSGMLSSQSKIMKDAPAADPEAFAGPETTGDERAMQRKLLQSFVTHVMEEYMLNLPSSNDDVPGMAWCSRIIETLHPERIIPQTETFATRFATEEKLHRRIDATGQLVTAAQDLGISDDQLLSAAITVETVAARDGNDEDDPPTSADEIPLSRLGSLMLYTVRQASTVLYKTLQSKTSPPFAIFPDHHELLKNCLSAPTHVNSTVGTEPEALIDAVLALAIVTLDRDSIGEPASDEQFNEYIQLTALLSSNCPSPNLRGHAHYLTSTVLRSHPDENVRLAFIRDTLEECPFENLKVSAVGWIKGETVEANPPTPLHDHEGDIDDDGNNEKSIFGTPLALDSVAPFLFPSLQADLLTAPIQEAWLTFRANLSFYLASLNFLYLLLCAKHLHHSLSIPDLWNNNDVAGSFLQPLKEASTRYKKAMEPGGELSEEKGDEVLAEMNVLGESTERVTAAVWFLNKS